MFKLNGKDYRDIELTFNDVCDLQEKGVDISNLSARNALPVIRAIIALRFNGDDRIAGHEIEQHIINGGSFEDLAEIVRKAIETSGFFRALNKTKTS